MGSVNIQGALREYGVISGMSSKQFGTLFSDCVQEQQHLQEALDTGVLPFWSSTDRSNSIQSWKDKFDSYDHIVVVASPMIVQSLEKIETLYNLHFVTSINSERSDWKDTLLVVLASNVWMDVWLSHHIEMSSASMNEVLYCVEEQTDLPKDIVLAGKVESTVEVGILDERFVFFTNFALALQANVTEALAGIDLGMRRITESTIWNNPSAILAVLACGLDFQPHLETVFVADSVSLRQVHSVAVLTGRMESRMSSDLISQGRHVLSQVVQVGEEGVFNMLSANPKQVVLLLRPEQDGEDSSLSRFQQVQFEILQQWLLNEQIPHVSWDVPRTWTTKTKMAFRIQWIHRSMLTVAMQGDDPTLYEAADRWRQTSTNLWNRLGSNLT